ncbi:Thiol:disulfide interchange protein tlpA [Granulibacter bethesdensis]|uniref:Thiol:disulfide interchange protein tlpA n=1 Tax=Granulibacter bethesdensis TaxID=364410 RepID=A0AAN0RBM6_9PROT|nr:TlpA disulfide reductase family protein [Granulibacter bethesdensis]AHJ61875.1 Thiol:disulfide interchange protein tlpA [Granulibacter bethesdensis]APH55905.1 Thiol:disulfide interchange protein tlpA [Granulibacter bethesdensis]
MPVSKHLKTRRTMLAAIGGTLAGGVMGRKLALSQASGATMGELPHGLKPVDPPARLPAFRFTDAMGDTRSMAYFNGKGVVLNLWATWCAPCVAEMPSLDQLAAAVKDEGIVVLPLSADQGGVQAVDNFYRKHGIVHLGTWLDHDGEAQTALKLRGIPTTLIIDRQGRERARLEGGTNWAAPAYHDAIRALVG